MIHEIEPNEYCVAYHNHTPASDDTVFLFDGDNVLCQIENSTIRFPRVCEMRIPDGIRINYLFSIDDDKFFMPDVKVSNQVNVPSGYKWEHCEMFRTVAPKHLAFAMITARQLYQWYLCNEYCGNCGAETEHSTTERALVCTQCGHITYPKIQPAVIIAVTDGNKILLVKTKSAMTIRYVLISGFVEIGETLEETVKREVFEETGLNVKNIRYYKSQPWALTSTILSGFFCEIDGSNELTIDNEELAEATWVHRDDVPTKQNDISLTSEMIEAFRTGEYLRNDCWNHQRQNEKHRPAL